MSEFYSTYAIHYDYYVFSLGIWGKGYCEGARLLIRWGYMVYYYLGLLGHVSLGSVQSSTTQCRGFTAHNFITE